MPFKKFEKIQKPLIIKILERLRIQGTKLDIIRSVYSKSAVNIKLNEKKLKIIPQISRKRQGCVLSP